MKAWSDQRRQPQYDPEAFLAAVRRANYRWEDLAGLVPRKLEADAEAICRAVRTRFAFLTDSGDREATLLADQTSHREQRLFAELRSEARIGFSGCDPDASPAGNGRMMTMTIMNGIAMMMGRRLGDATATPHISPRRASSITKRRETTPSAAKR